MNYESDNAENAVIRCPNCNAEVGTTDKSCGNCGNEMIEKKGAGAGSLVLLLLVVALIAAWFFSKG